MGQYRLWLYHREIDQLLHAQLKRQEEELAQLDAHSSSLLANTTLQADNAMIQTLLKGLQPDTCPVAAMPAQALSSQIPSSWTGNVTLSDAGAIQKEQHLPTSVSSVPSSQEHLPHFASADTHHPGRQIALLVESTPPTYLSVAHLLPTDERETCIETQSLRAAQPPISERLPTIIRSSHNILSNSPVDQQSSSVNQRVQRWFERRTRFAPETGKEV